jgi:signal transduction histidine kinase
MASEQTTPSLTARSWGFARAPLLGDLVVASVAFGLTLAVLADHTGKGRGLDPLGVVLAAASCFPLLAHRRAPLAVFALTTVASATLAGLGYPIGLPFGPTAALFFLASDARTPARLGRTATVVVGLYAIHVGATAIPHPHFPTTPVLAGIGLWGATWIIGDQVRQRRARLADLTERARHAEREIERERRLAAAEERTRIARDLHDSAAHAINVILVQAGGALLVQRRDPDAVTSALTTIQGVAGETIEEIDRLIRGLRSEGEVSQNGRTIEPPIGLAALPALARRHRAGGDQVEVRVEGGRQPLARGLDQAAYRILQESLTNAARHGGGPAEVVVTYGQGQLELTVSNPLSPGTNGGTGNTGHGILGMRERVALLGGSLEAAAGDGRFRVHARLPYVASVNR